jgi:hypothetical protein
MSEMYGTMDRFVGCFVCVCVFCVVKIRMRMNALEAHIF